MKYAYCKLCKMVTPHRELVQYVKRDDVVVKETYLQCLICGKYRKVRESVVEVIEDSKDVRV